MSGISAQRDRSNRNSREECIVDWTAESGGVSVRYWLAEEGSAWYMPT